MLSTSCWAAGCSSGHTISAPRRNIRLGITSGNLDFAYRRAQNSDYACDLTRSRCHQEPIVIGVRRILDKNGEMDLTIFAAASDLRLSA
jgi:hypothetical protein